MTDKVVYLGTGWFGFVDALRERAPANLHVHVWDRNTPITEVVRDADVILPSNTRFTAEILAAATRVSLIQQPAAGFDAIDIDAARARGIPVCNAPGANHHSLAEAAALLMLALARRVPEIPAAFHRRDIGKPVGMELCEKTLGIVGLGRSGRALARIAEALGMTVVGVTSQSGPDALADLLARADVVSLHLPLTKDTRGLLGREAFARIKRGAFLINCARGGIVDREAFEAALDSGQLAGAGLDTFWNEPWDPADPLFARENVIALPHIGGSTREAFARIADIVVDNIRRVHAGEPLRHRVA